MKINQKAFWSSSDLYWVKLLKLLRRKQQGLQNRYVVFICMFNIVCLLAISLYFC